MYSIGQVIYVLLKKNSQVYPMRVIEIITKKSLSGDEVRYRLQGGADASSTLMLDQIDGELFDTAEAARYSLLERATNHIDKLIRTAVNKSKEWYGVSSLQQETKSIDDLPPLAPRSSPGSSIDLREEEIDEDRSSFTQEEHSYVTLPDGTIAKIKLPKVM